jgi:AGCS family alanine or glycine:cation symporter
VIRLNKLFLELESLLAGYLPFCLLILGGIYITFKCKFIQFTGFMKSVKLIKNALKEKRKNTCGVSSFQAACTALSGTVGTGNIAGVAGALSIGGAGAVFWMWVSALIGMAVKFIEIALSVKFREKLDCEYVGGPMYYIKNGFNKSYKWLSVMFCIAALPAVICTGNITQTNAAVLSVSDNLLIRIALGLIFTFLTALVAVGGSKRIGIVTEKIVPLMSLLYVALTLGVIILNHKNLPQAFAKIFIGAFAPRSVTGGIVGSVISCILTGASRGVFSNEAGLGTSAMAHSVAYDAKTETQGYFGIFEVFIDTVLICTLTALTILCCGVNIEYGSISDARLVRECLFSTYGRFSGVMLAVMMLFFAFSSVIGWALYGGICAEFLFKKRGRRIFLIIYPLFCFVGALCNADFAWRF